MRHAESERPSEGERRYGGRRGDGETRCAGVNQRRHVEIGKHARYDDCGNGKRDEDDGDCKHETVGGSRAAWIHGELRHWLA